MSNVYIDAFIFAYSMDISKDMRSYTNHPEAEKLDFHLQSKNKCVPLPALHYITLELVKPKKQLSFLLRK